jgi:transaldolase
VWLDDLGRHRIESGELAHLVNDVGIVGVTTNPSIFAAAVRDGSEYQARLAAGGADVDQTVYDLMVSDVQDACTVFAPTYDRTAGLDGRVSLEVDPRLASDTGSTVAAAASAWHDVDRPNVMVKIPATREGLSAITQSLAAGISVNVTLIFGLQRYREVQDAWLAGLEGAQANGHDLSRIGSVASFFVSRLDSAVDKRLDALLDDDAVPAETHASLRGRAAVANARNAYRLFMETLATARWHALRDAGARPQRPLWASTSTKDPSFAPTRYVDELVAADTVNTMPAKTLEAVLSAGGPEKPRTSTIDVSPNGAAADADLFDDLAKAGVIYDDVVADLERDGVQSFIDAWNALLELVAQAQQRAAG